MSEVIGFPQGNRPGDTYADRPSDTEYPPEEMVEMLPLAQPCPDCGAGHGYLHSFRCKSFKPAPDMVNSPPHYKRNGIEAVDLIEHAIEDFPPIEAYHIATVLKYLLRAPYKGNRQQDIQKAHWHLSRLVRK